MWRLPPLFGLLPALSLCHGTHAQINGVELVSVSSTGEQANAPTNGWISRNGVAVLLSSQATNLIPIDGNDAYPDMFVRDLELATTTIASVNSNGEQPPGGSEFGCISETGRFVVFRTAWPNMIPGGTNGWTHVYIRDRETAQTEIISLTPSGQQATGPSSECAVSPDGRYVTFYNGAGSIGQLYLRDRLKSQTEVISVASNGNAAYGTVLYGATLSDDGRFIAFGSDGMDMEPTVFWPAIYLRDRLLGETVHVSVSIAGTGPNGQCYPPEISGDGRYVAFASDASNLVTDDTNGATDIFVRDMLLGQTTRVSIAGDGEQANAPTDIGVSITNNGRYVIFNSWATNMIDSDVNGWPDGFVHDRWTGQTELVTLTWQGEQLHDRSFVTGISDDGRLVSFISQAATVVPQTLSGDFATFVRARWKLGDINRDGVVNVIDLLAIINAWGPCPAPPPPPALPIPCDADVTNDNTVNVADLLLIINNWG